MIAPREMSTIHQEQQRSYSTLVHTSIWGKPKCNVETAYNFIQEIYGQNLRPHHVKLSQVFWETKVKSRQNYHLW